MHRIAGELPPPVTFCVFTTHHAHFPQGKFEPDDPDRPTDLWCQSNCAKDPPECPVEKCFCADENAILTFGGDDATSTSDPVRQDEHKLQQTKKPIPQDVEDTHSAQYLCMKYNTHCALAAVERRAHSERCAGTWSNPEPH